MAESKTNAMRMLDRAKIPYQVHLYSHEDIQSAAVPSGHQRLVNH